MRQIESESLTAPGFPSSCSGTAVVEGREDEVSLVSTEDDNRTNLMENSEPQTLVALRNDSQRDCSFKDGVKCNANTNDRESDNQQRRPVEEPKPVWTKSKKRAFHHFLLLHSVPLTATVVLFCLYLKGFQWEANDIQLKALLFAAKLHESLIVISLADILFHRIRYHLLTSRGISFGLLVAPFRVSNPLSLFQAPFLAPAKFTLRSGPELLTVSLVVLVSLLALLSAPSSAALMLPRYDWWPIPSGDDTLRTFQNRDLEDATYVGAPCEELFPSLIDAQFSPNEVRDDRDAPTLSNRFEQIISGLERVLIPGSSNANITVVDATTVDSFELAYQTSYDCKVSTSQKNSKRRALSTSEVTPASSDQDPSPECPSFAVQGTSPLAIVTQKLFRGLRGWMSISGSPSVFKIMAQALDSKKRALSWRQPSVSMQCSTVAHDSPHEIIFQRWGTSPFVISPDRQLWQQIENLNTTGSSTREKTPVYIDINRLIPPGVAASAALLMESNSISPGTSGSIEIFLCLLDARWISSDIWYSAPYATFMRSGVSMESAQAMTGSNRIAADNSVFNIATEYSNSLNANLSIAAAFMGAPVPEVSESPFELIRRLCSERFERNLDMHSKCQMLAHVLYMTDSLKRTQSRFGYHSASEVPRSENLSSVEPEKWTKLNYELYHQSHAYKFEGSIIKLSMTVLLVHMMLVYAHLLLLVLGDGWCSRAWSELGELIALAILTQPSSLLQNTGGGIENWKTWNLRTFVREVSPEGRLELVLKETGGSPRVLVEPEEGRDVTLVEPEADRRYG